MKNSKLRKSYEKPAFQVFITIWTTFCVLFLLIPLTITIINSFKSHDEIMTSIFAWTKTGAGKNFVENYKMALLGTDIKIGLYKPFLRTILLCIIGAIGNVALGSVLAYQFTYKEFPFKEGLFMMFIAVMLLPGIMGMPTLVPLIKIKLNLGNSMFGYLLPTYAGGQVTTLFLFRTFFGQQPKSVYESAQIEGANDLFIYMRITLPLAFAIILYQAVNAFSSVYNDYLWPSLLWMANQDMHTVTLVLRSNSDTWKVDSYGAIYAMYILSSIPLIFTSAISMKYFSGGDFASGMKL
ncbi:MAG: carbohydrate ABC transporter permease [Clostridia bacterium]|nr:carbohydrate ABC transporter permease [Clostridia bacterium]